MKGTEESKIKRLEGTIRRRDKLIEKLHRQIEKLQKELEAKQKHLDRIKNDLLPPIYKEIKIAEGQLDVAKADVAVIQAWICAIIMRHLDADGVEISDEAVSAMLQEYRLKAEKTDIGTVVLMVEKRPEEEAQ
jgi:uncharacterized coiled-coil protein SlyX